MIKKATLERLSRARILQELKDKGWEDSPGKTTMRPSKCLKSMCVMLKSMYGLVQKRKANSLHLVQYGAKNACQMNSY